MAGCGEAAANGRRAVVAGNSIGGYCALAVAAEYPELCLGVASLNGAGRFSPSAEEAELLRRAEEERAARGALRVAVDEAAARLVTALQRAVALILTLTRTRTRTRTRTLTRTRTRTRTLTR